MCVDLPDLIAKLLHDLCLKACIAAFHSVEKLERLTRWWRNDLSFSLGHLD